LSEEFTLGEEIITLNQQEPINVTSMDPITLNEDVQVIRADLAATNGVLHIVDQVLLPQFTDVSIMELAQGMPDTFSTLVELLELANLTAVLDDVEEGLTGMWTVG
jgi:Fasciclin domain